MTGGPGTDGGLGSGGPIDPAALAARAALLADRTRAAFCLALIDGRAWTAGELARHAGVAPSTASAHLDRLVDAGLLVAERQGRHRYLRLGGPDVARTIETLAAGTAPAPPAPTLRASRAAARLASARTCYDHLAGALGVALFDGLVADDLLATGDGLALTPAGRLWFAGLAGPDALARRGRPVVRACLDWTERRHHLAGTAGAVLCRALFDRGWVERGRDRRSVRLTASGRTALPALVGVALPD
ncbi:ArsR/SmtB family transcription factor [Pseudonocardia alni]|uniref:ArsR/SmtB family transcription factor n=1 Tax=Pseudonocardia alni TaxID=33907 RepID=UPI001CCF6B0A|nr:MULTISPECIES: helix-turn-helix domain-containing protein [Pseudonocardia]MBO4240184.1 helix-turn-helix domain-containing protein [Pseudonocardia alni]